ncbi:putative phosphodiesterase [Candidatus Nitrososphaera gargensis Ga9.2]|uniref:Phosphoesterase n=1 Tax=Nitrososphaera gargensis (strain Ga9.2) TaxID=1237085 RepID=K0INY9_NITGG|nr:metallophosphoesterase [Candidatus Nitrososphaera gargensis]AFU60204.1 putative phosphodiesterase [Candidatus Nitrososphaera gargensis Ga9.2]
MKIGLISDTHDNIRNIEIATEIFAERKVDLIIHAGDITTPEAVEAFSDSIRVIGVLGNNDVDIKGLTNAFQKIKGELRGDFCEIEQDGLLIAVYHGTEFKRRESIIQSGKYDVVVYGHTHKTENNIVGNKTMVINPGTANGWFFGYRATAAILDTITKECEFVDL